MVNHLRKTVQQTNPKRSILAAKESYQHRSDLGLVLIVGQLSSNTEHNTENLGTATAELN